MTAAKRTTAARRPGGPADEAAELEATTSIAAPEGAGPDEQLTAALAAAQATFPTILKGNTATVPTKTGGSYTYTYADLGDVLSAIRPVLAANGLAIVQTTRREPSGTVLVTTLRHVAGGQITTEVDVGQAPSNPQQFGGALTYLRRYALTTLLGVAAEDDGDAQTVTPSNGRQQAAPAPELPAWAQPAAHARKTEWRDELAPYIGAERATELGTALATTWGAFPDGATAIAKAIVGAFRDELDGSELQEAMQQAAERRAAIAAQAAAEAPDEPAPEPEPQAEPEPQDGPPLEPEQPAEPPPPAAAPATVPLPMEDLVAAGDDEQRRQLLRGLGCTCPDPLGAENAKDQACPIAGHGIPF